MNILFVCTGNTCRSPMAQALLEAEAKKNKLDINVKSAGIFALDGDNPSRGAIEALEVENIDLRNHKATMVKRDLLEESDLILTMSRSHKTTLLSKYKFVKGKIFTLKEYAYGVDEDVEDPFGGDVHIYNMTKEEIKSALKEIIKKL